MSNGADNHHAFTALAARHATDLYRYARWLTRDAHLAEDLVQETLLRGWRSFESLRDDGSARAWFITTLRREYFRGLDGAEAKAVRVSLDDEDAPLADEALLSWPNARDARIDVERCLGRLAPQYREVLVLQAYFGYSTDEMAVLLETSVTAVSNRLLRARRALSDAAAEPGPGAVVLPMRRRTA